MNNRCVGNFFISLLFTFQVNASEIIVQMGSKTFTSQGQSYILVSNSPSSEGFYYDGPVEYTVSGTLVEFAYDMEPFQKEKKLKNQIPFIADQTLEWLVPEGEYYKIQFITMDGDTHILEEGFGDGTILSFTFSDLKNFNGFGYLQGLSTYESWTRPVRFF